MHVRRAIRADLEPILEISNRAARETAANFAIAPETLASWHRDFDETQARFPWFVALDRDGPDDPGTVTGFAKASPWKGRCAYEFAAETSVYVRPEMHRRGTGRTLYARLLGTLDAQGYHALLAGIALPNDASVRLHESFGFRRVALREQVGWEFGRWHDVGYWERLLRPDGTAPDRLRTVDDVES